MEFTEILSFVYSHGKAVCDVRGHPTQALERAYEAFDTVMKGFRPWHISEVSMLRNPSLKDSEQTMKVVAMIEDYSEPHV